MNGYIKMDLRSNVEPFEKNPNLITVSSSDSSDYRELLLTLVASGIEVLYVGDFDMMNHLEQDVRESIVVYDLHKDFIGHCPGRDLDERRIGAIVVHDSEAADVMGNSLRLFVHERVSDLAAENGVRLYVNHLCLSGSFE